VLDVISDEITRQFNMADEAKPLREMQTFLMKTKSKSFIRGAVITVLICAALIGVFIGLTQLRIIPISSDLLEVSGFCQLSDKSFIIVDYTINDNIHVRRIKYTIDKDGRFYMTPLRTIINERLPDSLLIYPRQLSIHPDSYDTEITAIYFGPVGNGILVWEKGMDMPVSSEDFESIMGAKE